MYSELNVFNLSGSVFQVEDPEKAKLVLNRSIRWRGETCRVSMKKVTQIMGCLASVYLEHSYTLI